MNLVQRRNLERVDPIYLICRTMGSYNKSKQSLNMIEEYNSTESLRAAGLLAKDLTDEYNSAFSLICSGLK